MEVVFQVLYTLTTALLIPVVSGLLALLAWSLFQVGGWLSEWRERFRTTPLERWSVDGDSSIAMDPRSTEPPRVLLDTELRMTRRLMRLRWAVRLGPMLGLMGTLIPMGPALLEFSSGDFEAASAQIVIAFGTTVIGLLIAAVTYTLWLIRKLWYAQDLAELEHGLSHETTICTAPTEPVGVPAASDHSATSVG